MNNLYSSIAATILAALAFLSTGPTEAASVCGDAVRKVAWNASGATNWDPRNVDRLCAGAEQYHSPADCFSNFMWHSPKQWGRSGRFDWNTAVELCQGAWHHNASVACFDNNLLFGVPVAQAIQSCRTNSTNFSSRDNVPHANNLTEQVWQSDFGPIHWAQNYYGDPSKRLSGLFRFKDGPMIFEGTWSRSGSSNTGAVRFVFDWSGLRFEGSYVAADNTRKPWNGQM